MLKLYLYIFFCFFVINLNNISNSYTKLFDPKIPDDINVSISWKYLKEYSDNINKISLNPRAPISDKYKKSFKSKIHYKDDNEQLKILPARIRITGDWQDHIDRKKKISSLKINLRKENIGHIVKFRLLLDKSRDFEAEIFWSSLLEVLGYPVLYKKIVNVSINGLPPEKMLFEEIAVKEFMERFSLREAPILEKDERKYWDLMSYAYKNCSSYMDRSLLNHQRICVKNILDDINFEEKVKFLNWKVDNKSFLKNDTSIKIGIKSIVNLNEKNVKKKKEFHSLNYKLANHGLAEHNLKRIFDPIYNFYIPLYYDGNVTSKSLNGFCKTWSIKEDLNIDVKKISNLFLSRTGKIINNNFLCVARYYLSDNKNYFSINNILENHSFKLHHLNNDYQKEIVLKTDENFLKNQICTSLKCLNIKKSSLKKIIAGDYIYRDEKNNKLFPQVQNEMNSKNKLKVLKNYEDNSKDILLNVNDYETLYVEFKNTDNNIEINLNGPFSRVVIYNSKINNSLIKINYQNEIKNKILYDNYDENLLTGCVTIIDSFLNNISIESDYSSCEDSINFIRSKGVINMLNLKNSQFDLVDFDFSEINIKKAILSNAKNDCLDYSYGKYIITELVATNCNDKAVSVGEKSFLKLYKFVGNKNNIDIAVKDSSKMHITNFVSNKQSNEKCIFIYKKKQEFNGGTVLYEGKKPNCLIEKDLYSRIEFNAEK